MSDKKTFEQADVGGFFKSGIRKVFIDCGRILGSSLAEMYCIKSPIIGSFLWIGLLYNLRFPLFTVAGIVISDVFISVLSLRCDEAEVKSFHVNGALTGLACSWLLESSYLGYPYQLFITSIAVIISSIFTATISSILEDSKLPPLTLGYSLAAGFMFQLFPLWAHHTNDALSKWQYPIGVIGWFDSFLRSLGALLYQPRPEVGLAIALALLLWSRIMFINGLLAWVSGIFTGLLLARLDVRYFWLLSAHNYFTAGMLLSCVYFLPGRFSIPIALFAGVLSSLFAAVIQIIHPDSAWAFLPIPSSIVILIGIKTLSFGKVRSFIRENNIPLIQPEYAWWITERWRLCFGINEPLLMIPLSQPVCIAQSFSGDLSHRGEWKHAIDFVHIPVNLLGESNLSLWDTAIYSPGFGIIERYRDDIPDNPLGVSNFANNWGNFVVIRLDVGGWVLLAHLKQGSVTVKSGAAVNTGDYIGKVGNSGRSPFPHLHMQAQILPYPGSPTRAFRLANYLNGGEERGPLIRWVAAGVPQLGSELVAAAPNPLIFSLITRFAPGVAVWGYQYSGSLPNPYTHLKTGSLITISIDIDNAGRHILNSSAGGTIIANMDPDAWRIYETHNLTCPILSLISIVAVSIPYSLSSNVHWQEILFDNGSNRFDWFNKLIAPYVRYPFTNISCVCSKMPDPDGRGLVIKTVPDAPLKNLPKMVEGTFSTIRGIETINGEFFDGAVIGTLISFEPKYPSQGNKPVSIVSDHVNIKDLNQARKNHVL